MIDLNSIPTSNTLNFRVSLLRGGHIVATLDAGDARTLDVRFDQVMLVNPGHPPVVRNQNPAAAVGVHPGNIAFFETVANGLDLNYSMPGGPANVVHFT